MTVLKIFFHINALAFRFFYQIIYGRRLMFGKGVTFRKGFSLTIFLKGKIVIGKNCFFNNYCSLASTNSIVIGNDTLFGENVKVYDHNHIYSDLNIPIKDQGYSEAPIVIGSHCWIGSNVVILKGVNIGDNVIIGAGCVIFKSVPANTVVINKQQLQLR